MTRLLILLVTIAFAWSNTLHANTLQDVRVWPSPDKFRLVFDLKEKPEFSYFSLTKGDRLVIDFSHTKLTANLASLVIKSDIAKKLRISKAPKKGMLRLVIDLKHATSPRIFPLPPTGPYGNRLVVDLLKHAVPVAVTRPQTKSQPTKVADTWRQRNRDIVIAIDAGHGGEDPGSIGASGRYEKRITLAISKMLAKKINNTKGLKAVLTRKSDYYVGVNRRSEIARKAKSDLLLSIHADAFTSAGPNGASVLLLSSKRANTEIGRILENHEKHSDLLGGVGKIIDSTENEKYLARTIIDMSMDKRMDESFTIARGILSKLSRVTKLHSREPILASLGVLKSADFPSLLVETGFVSNPKEEKRLYDPRHRVKLVNAIYAGVDSYFKKNAPDGTYYANYRPQTHKVVSGDSLSMLAKRYNISVGTLKKYNAMRSNRLLIGQVLKIPQG